MYTKQRARAMTQNTPPLRSRVWFDNPASPDMTAPYLERYPMSIDEPQSDRPITGIAQTMGLPRYSH